MKKSWLLSILLLFSVPSRAWGPEGHRVVGKIAERFLTPRTRVAINRLLGGQPLSSCTTWMDEMRRNPQFRYMANWHWVTIETGKTYAQSPKNPRGDIIAILEKTLKESKSNKDKLFALRIVAHLIGDLHMPLHVGCCGDKGGNKIKVTWNGRRTSLHRVWDEDLIHENGLKDNELAASLLPMAEKLNRKKSPIDIRRWAEEALAFRKQVYNIGDGKLDKAYFAKNRPLLQKRLAIAGVRLAQALNKYF